MDFLRSNSYCRCTDLIQINDDGIENNLSRSITVGLQFDRLVALGGLVNRADDPHVL
jgi:hypothetical protein